MSTPRTRPSDILEQAARALWGRGWRSILPAVGVAVALGAAVTVLMLTMSADNAVKVVFDRMKATSVVAELDGPSPTLDSRLQRVRDLPTVRAAGLATTATEDVSLTRIGTGRPTKATLRAITPEGLAAMRIHPVVGRLYDHAHERLVAANPGSCVTLLGTGVAKELGIGNSALPPGLTISVNGRRCSVLGVVTSNDPTVLLGASVIMPFAVTGTESTLPEFGTLEVRTRTELGAAPTVGDALPLVLLPEAPAKLKVRVPPAPVLLQQTVGEQTRALFVALVIVFGVVGTAAITNTLGSALHARRGEIGLRRAVGASRKVILGQLLAEGALLGVAGGTIGAVVGFNASGVLASVRGWELIVDPVIPLAAPGAGLVLGLAASALPAWRATRITPAEALRVL